MLYFAYGANTNLDSMDYRCPAARVVGVAVLRNHRLVMRGVADVSPDADACVHGVVWEITPECEASLDQFEGFPYLYGKRGVPVMLADGSEAECMMYYMRAQRGESPPSDGYYHTLAEGYRSHGISLRQLNRAVDDAATGFSSYMPENRWDLMRRAASVRG